MIIIWFYFMNGENNLGSLLEAISMKYISNKKKV